MATGTRCFFRSREAAVDALDVEVDRLLAQHGLAHVRRRRDEIDMGVCRRGDHDGIDLGIGQRRRGIGRRPRTKLLRQLGRRLGHGIDDVFDARLRMRGDIARMQLADAARAEDAEGQIILCHE